MADEPEGPELAGAVGLPPEVLYAPQRLHVALGAGLLVTLVVGGFWYLAAIGTDSQMMPVSLLLGWATAAAMTRVTNRHGYTFAVYVVALVLTAVLVMLFFIQRLSLNRDPRNDIPVWANPTIVADVLRVGFSAWPMHYLWLAGAVAIAAWVGVRGPGSHHVHLLERFGTRADDSPMTP